MEFSYSRYGAMINRFSDAGFEMSGYNNYMEKEKPCILRHDVDFSLKKALEFAEFENRNGIFSTFFILLTSKMYNTLSKDSLRIIRRISDLGHDIGLHFDETRYSGRSDGGVENILFEKEILEKMSGVQINVVSMHEPSKDFLESDIEIPGMINSYSETFFNEFRYCSDSRRLWRDDPEDIVKLVNEKGLHILTHPVWWSENEAGQDQALYELIDSTVKDIEYYIYQYYPDFKGYTD